MLVWTWNTVMSISRQNICVPIFSMAQ